MTEGATKEEREAKIATQSLKSAEECWSSQNYGRAFAHFLLVLKLDPDKKSEIKSKFCIAFQEWCRDLESQSRIEDLFLCYEQACELFPECESVMNSMGTQLFRLGYVDEAASCFRRALRIDPDFLGARENLENVCSHLVERWHFRMLNDITRNESFKNSIQRAVDHGRNRVLDIGAGTGLLSMFSVQSGADVTYACEMSKPMYELAKDVLAANGMGEAVNLFHKKSTDLKVGQELDSRVDLVVTETVDAGLLGEHIVPTVLHAWAELLQPGGQVIPAGATVFACGIECKDIRKQNRLLYSGIRHLDLSSLAIVCATGHDEVAQDPYTTEKLAMVRSGYKQLTAAHKILELDFNSPEDLKNCTCGALKEFKFPIVTCGRLDAIAIWFDLKLDTDVTFSTVPGSPTCWEQAVFPILHHHLAAAGVGHRENMTVKPDDVAIIVSQCLEDHIELRCCHIHHHDPSNETSINTDSIEQITEAFLAMSPTNYENETHKSMHFLERPMMGCLNNLQMNTAYCMAMETLKEKNHHCLQLFDLNSGFSPLGLQALKLGFSHVFLTSDEHRPLLSAIAEANKISMDQVTFTGRNFDELGINCDIILSEIVEPCGALRQQVLEDVALARLQCMDREGHVIPHQVTAYGMVIESESLLQDSQVKDGDATTLGLEVAKFMNDFQMTTHVDIDLLTLPHTRLTAPFKLLTLNLNEKTTRNVPSFLEQENLHKVEVIKDGRATAILYWFDFTLINNIKLCTLDTDSHWKQAAVMVKTEKLLNTGDKLSVRVILKNSCIDIKLE